MLTVNGAREDSLSSFFRLAFLSLCFTATWAVMSYPEIKAVVLDASFDDLLPLAFKVMPDSWSESDRGSPTVRRPPSRL